MTNQYVAALQRIVEHKSANVLSDAKALRLLKTMEQRAPGLSISGALAALEKEPQLPAWARTDLTVNETFFFRHPKHFEVLREELAKRPRASALRVLSVGCSSGEETYSIAMVMAELNLLVTSEVVGVDLDPAMVERAQSGSYSPMSKSRTPKEFLSLLEEHTGMKRGARGEQLVVKQTIASKTRFSCQNAFEAPVGMVDVVFVRNILCYFREEKRTSLLQRLTANLRPGGIVFIGGGELFPKGAKLDELPGHSSIARKRLLP